MKEEIKKEEISIEVKRHSLSHILAYAIKELYPNAKLSIGPAIETGFYYDIDFGEVKLSEKELKEVEKKMAYLIKQNLKFEKSELEIDEAIKKENSEGEIYKTELITDLKAGGETVVSYYTVGKFKDLCRGPHITNTNQIKDIAKRSSAQLNTYLFLSIKKCDDVNSTNLNNYTYILTSAINHF